MQPRAHYLRELADVQDALTQLADAVDQMLARALRAFRDNDTGAAHDTLRADDEIDDRRYALEERVLGVIAAQQPLASDLRFLIAAIQVATELERIGDYANGIGALVIRNAHTSACPAPDDVLRLAELVRAMLADSMRAFLARDPNAAAHFEHDDDMADALFAAILDRITRDLSAPPQQPRGSLHVLFVAHNLERIADRAVNIAERATFVATGVVQPTQTQPTSNAT